MVSGQQRPTPSSGQHPSGLATRKQEYLVEWLDLSSKIALGFSNFVGK